MDLTNLTISEIAFLIRKEWKKINFAAEPYLEAMECFDGVDPKVLMYGLDDGVSVVLYFLGNANSFRGDLAREVKRELNRRCK